MELADLINGQDKLESELGQLINKYQFLPACMIEPILKNYHEQIMDIKQKQSIEAKQLIENRGKKQKKDHEKGDK